MSLPPLIDLTVPDPGSTTARLVLGAFLKKNLSDLLRLPLGRFPARLFDDFSDVRRSIERLLEERRAGVAFSLTRQIGVSTLVQCLVRELYGSGDVERLDAWLSELTATLALELAASGELRPEGLRLQQAPSRFVSHAANLAVTLPPGATVGFLPGRLRVAAAGSEAEVDLAGEPPGDVLEGVTLTRAHVPLAGGLRLALVDTNPLALHEAHPDKEGNALDLGGKSPEQWRAALDDAHGRVERWLPALAEELRLVVQALVPVGYHAERHLSASYAEAVGLVYLTLHPDPMTMTEALIHEFSHNKLNAAFDVAPLLENAFHPLYASPVRPDPRPLHGVLLAVHAFVPVACLYERMLEGGDPLAGAPRFEERFREIVKGNHEGTTTLLEHARPTVAGRPLLDELARWDEHFRRWR